MQTLPRIAPLPHYNIPSNHKPRTSNLKPQGIEPGAPFAFAIGTHNIQITLHPLKTDANDPVVKAVSCWFEISVVDREVRRRVTRLRRSQPIPNNRCLTTDA